MPLVKISTQKGKTRGFKKIILNSIHEALVLELKIPEDDRIQRWTEFDKSSFEAENKNADTLIIIEITLFKGRSFQAKKAFYSTCVRLITERTKTDGNDIIIILNDVEPENWGIRGGKPASEVNLGFKIGV